MMDLGAYARDVLEPLQAAGVHVATDWRDITSPGVLISPFEIDYERLADDVHTITWELVLIGTATGADAALDDLGQLAATVHTVWPEAHTFQARTVTSRNLSPDPLPALRTTIQLDHYKETQT